MLPSYARSYLCSTYTHAKRHRTQTVYVDCKSGVMWNNMGARCMAWRSIASNLQRPYLTGEAAAPVMASTLHDFTRRSTALLHPQASQRDQKGSITLPRKVGETLHPATVICVTCMPWDSSRFKTASTSVTAQTVSQKGNWQPCPFTLSKTATRLQSLRFSSRERSEGDIDVAWRTDWGRCQWSHVAPQGGCRLLAVCTRRSCCALDAHHTLTSKIEN